MLNAIRRAARSWLVKALLALLIVSFAVWGVGDIFRSGAGGAVAEVGERKITPAEFAREMDRELAYLRRQTDQNIDVQTAVQMGVDRMVLDRMVFQEALIQAAHEAGLRVPKTLVMDRIAEMDVFRDDFGQFDSFAFSNYLRQMNMSESAFVAATRANIAREQLAGALLAGVVPPGTMVDALYRYRAEERSARYLVVPAESMTVPEADAETVREFYDNHPDRFRQPEYRSLTVMTLAPEDLADEIAVSEAELRQQYEANIDRYSTPGVRTVQQIVVPDEAEAKALMQKIRGGTDFIAAAKEAGRTQDDIEIGEVEREDLAAIDPALADAAFALETPGLAGPVQTPFGWHILRVSEIVAGEVRPFEAVRDEIRADVARERAMDALFDMADTVEDSLASGATLEETANTLDLPLRKIESINRQGYTKQDRRVSDLPGGQFLTTAFEKQPGGYLDLNETDEGGYYVVRVDQVTPATIKPFDAVREAAKEAYLQQQRLNAARERAEALKARVAEGADLGNLAKQNDLAVETASGLRRGDRNASPALGPRLIEALFASRRGGVVSGPKPTEDAFVVAEVTQVTPADAGSDPEGRQALRRDLDDVLANDVLAQFRMALHDRYDIRINRAVLEQALQTQ